MSTAERMRVSILCQLKDLCETHFSLRNRVGTGVEWIAIMQSLAVKASLDSGLRRNDGVMQRSPSRQREREWEWELFRFRQGYARVYNLGARVTAKQSIDGSLSTLGTCGLDSSSGLVPGANVLDLIPSDKG